MFALDGCENKEENFQKEKTQKQFLNKMIDSLFAGSSTELVLQALGNK